jgi:hypothetical protein
MTMDTTTETPVAPPKPKRKWTRKAKPAAPPQKASEFAGLTIMDCCDGCTENKCVITGLNVCGHPAKGGLQSAQLGKMDVVKRFNRAKNMLAGQKFRAD